MNVCSCRIGDDLYLVTQEGFTDDVEPLLCGYITRSRLRADCGEACWVETCRLGMCWDEQRTIIFLEGNCDMPEALAVLRDAGFTVL